MPLFLSDEEFERCSNDACAVADKADSFIRDLYNQLETVRAQADASSITAEQTCALLEQKYISLSDDFAKIESQNAQLNASLEQRLSELAEVQSEKHQLYLKSIEKDREIERLSIEASGLHKSKRELLELIEKKDSEISEKSATIKSYLDKIVNLTENGALREARLHDLEADVARSNAALSRLSQEKELIEKHNTWLNDELTAKVSSLLELRRSHSDFESDMSAKLATVQRECNECASSLSWHKQRLRELELKLKATQEDLCSTKDAAAANEERFSTEISTVTKLVELYKESSEEWSSKAGELEGVIRALETHLNQVENDYKEKLEKEVSARSKVDKEATELKEKLAKCEAELENYRKANDMSLLPLSNFVEQRLICGTRVDDISEDNSMIIPRIPAGVSGTALAASLLRDGWSLAKIYEKYQEAVDALRHERLGRKQSEAVLERVLFEIEQKAEVILDERAEHERMIEAYSVMDRKLQQSLSEQVKLESNIKQSKADLRRREREYLMAQKEISDLQKQVAVLLKECRDVQLRCGSVTHTTNDDYITHTAYEVADESDTERVISERLLTFTDISGLVEQNVQLRSIVRCLSDQNEKRDNELKESFELELRKQSEDAASKVSAVLQRSEEQGRMIESLHSSVAMYKRLYEEELKLHGSQSDSGVAIPDHGRKDLMLLLEGSQEATKKAHEQVLERAKHLEEELSKSRSETMSIRLERDKLAMEANFARERFDSFMKEFEHQRDEVNGVLARNVEFSQQIVDHQRKLRENADSLLASEELSRKLTMEVSILRHEKEMLLNAENRASDEVRRLSERVHRLQASLDTIQSAHEIREDASVKERRMQEEYFKRLEREWAEAKEELQVERENVRNLTLDRERAEKNAMERVEEIRKELHDALHAVAAAEARAAIAESRLSDLKANISHNKALAIDSAYDHSICSTNEVGVDLLKAKEDVLKLKEEAQANLDHMLQYKNIAQVNETALKQMESAHEKFKSEADKLKKSLEAEILALRERVSELEQNCTMKSVEAASSVAGKEEALHAAFAEITNLKEENSERISKIMGLEIQVSSLKEDLEKENQRWRTAQNNYERQVILQSETIQELTKTSQALATLQEEAAQLRKLADALKSENDILKATWETEKAVLEQSNIDNERKYNEINEQNKILHDHLEALHIKMAERERNSTGASSGTTVSDLHVDTDLQTVVHYLRRSKEIAETEMSLLKQEKLRLQSQLESALKANETAQSLLHSERSKSSALLFTDEEFKALQTQVGEINLFRESNIQLREENKYNFEECQKLREISQKARIETEQMEVLLREKQIELDACKKEIHIQMIEKGNLENRIVELLEKYKSISLEDYGSMKDDLQQMQVRLREKVAEVEETKRLVSERDDMISRLEQDLARELNEKEKRDNDKLQVEALKLDFEKQKKGVLYYKRRVESLTKEKEELNKDKQTLSMLQKRVDSLTKEKEELNKDKQAHMILQKRVESVTKEKEELMKDKQALSKQLEESRQGKRLVGDSSTDQAMKEKEKEKDTRIQTLEKALERERIKRKQSEMTIMATVSTVNEDKKKVLDELERHKTARSLPTERAGALGAHPSETTLEDLTAHYLIAVDKFTSGANSFVNDGNAGAAAETSTLVDTPTTETAARQVPGQSIALQSTVNTPSGRPAARTVQREKRPTPPKPNVESRKLGRRLIRPRLGNSEESTVDVEMLEPDLPSTAEAKLGSSQVNEPQNNTGLPSQLSARKRLASSLSSEHREEIETQQESGSNLAAHVPKKSKGLVSGQDTTERQPVVPTEVLESPNPVEEPCDVSDLPMPSATHEETVDVEKDEVDIRKEPAEESNEPPLDTANQAESESEFIAVPEEDSDKARESEEDNDEERDEEEQDPQPGGEIEDDREEGELLMPDPIAEQEGDDESTMNTEQAEDLPETSTFPEATVGTPTDEEIVAEAVEAASPEISFEEKNDMVGEGLEEIAEDSDKSVDNNDKGAMDNTEQSPKSTFGTGESSSVASLAEPTDSKQGSQTPLQETEEAKEASAKAVINLTERARQGAMLRRGTVPPQAGHGSTPSAVSPSPINRGRGRVRPRGRVLRGGRYVRGQGPDDRAQP